jgi:glycosyltransferase 2 family protein
VPNRPSIPISTQREVLFESRHRCAVCGDSSAIEFAHIVAWHKTHDHSAANLIALCSKCHTRADKENWGESYLRRYKQKPWAMERDLMPPMSPEQKALVDLIVSTDPDKMTENQRLRLASMIAAYVGVHFDDVKIISVRPANSSKIRIELPSHAVKQLIMGFKSNDPKLKALLDDIELLTIEEIKVASFEEALTSKSPYETIEPRNHGMKLNKWVAAGIGVLISVVFLWIAFRNLKPEEILSVIREVNLAWLLLAAGVFFISTILIAWRWQFLLRSIKPVSLGYLTQVVLIGYMGNNIYPFRTGEILRIVLLQRFQQIAAAKSTVTVIVERVFDGLVLLTFILISVNLLGITSPEIAAMARFGTPLFLFALVVFFVLATRPDMFRRLLHHISRLLPGKLQGIAEHIGEGIISGLEGLRSPADLAGAIFASYASWGVQAIMYWMVAFAFNLNVSLVAMFLVVGVSNLAGLVPASPGQIGVFEFFVGLVLTAVGINDTQAHAYALVMHVVIWLPAVLTGFYFLIRQGLGWNAITHAQELEQKAVG